MSAATTLVEGVGAGSPPGEEDGETDRLEGLGGDGDTDGVKGTPLRDGLDEDLECDVSVLLIQGSYRVEVNLHREQQWQRR